MQETNKKFKAIFYLGVFLLFLGLATLFVYGFNTYKIYGIFSSDCPRVFYDFTDVNANHYRTSIHPLYVILTIPITKLISLFFVNNVLAVIVFLTAISTLNVYLFEKFLDRLSPSRTNSLIKILFLCVYITSFAIIENVIIVESFTLNLFAFLIFWNYFFKIKDKKLSIKNYIVLILIGVLNYGITLTNFVSFLIGISFLIIFNKRKSFKQYAKDSLKVLVILVCSLYVVVLLSYAQYRTFNTSFEPFVFFKNLIKDVFLKVPSEDTNYMRFDISFLINSFVYTFSNFLFGTNPVKMQPADGYAVVEFAGLSIFNICLSIVIFALFVYSVIVLIKNKNKALWPLLIALLFEFILHTIYGGSEPWLYPINYSFIVVGIIYAALTTAKNKKFKTVIASGLIMILLLNVIFNIKMLITVPQICFERTSLLKTAAAFSYLLVEISLLAVLGYCLFVIFKKNNNSLQTQGPKSENKGFLNVKNSILILLIVSFIALTVLPIFVQYNKDKNKGKNETTFAEIDTSQMDKIAVFGMGLRKKFVVENSSIGLVLYEFDPELKTKTVLESNLEFISYDAVNYEINLKSIDNKNIRIYENEDGVYYKKDGELVRELDVRNT